MISLYYDEITSLIDFLHALKYQYYSQISSAWIEAIYCHLIDEALEWAKNDENVIRIHYNAYHNVAMNRDERRLHQLLNERFSTSLRFRVDKAFKEIKQKRHEFIEDYYERVKTLFEHLEDQNKSIDQNHYLDYEHDFCLYEVIDWFVDDLRNNKMRRIMIETLQFLSAEDKVIDVSFESICIATQ